MDGGCVCVYEQLGALGGKIRQIQKSARVKLDRRKKVPSALAAVIVEIGGQYVSQQGFHAVVTAYDIWSVHSYAGDYNPLHDHGGKTPLWLFLILFLKVPPVFSGKAARPHGGSPKVNMSTGHFDG